MKSIVIKNLSALLLVVVISAIFIVIIQNQYRAERSELLSLIEDIIKIEGFNLDNPSHRVMLEESLNYQYGSSSYVDSVLTKLEEYRVKRFTDPELMAGGVKKGITYNKLTNLFLPFLKFVVIFILSFILLYYGVRTAALFRFIRYKQGRSSELEYLTKLVLSKNQRDIKEVLKSICFILLKTVAYVLLFSPAYVAAYAVKTKVDTGSFLFILLLSVLTNGALISYIAKFFTMLLHESRKGYVENAIVKNINSNYSFNTEDGIKLKSLFMFSKNFQNHVLNQIYKNALFQYLPLLKIQAGFLITGLVIIEMALNLHGLLFYEMLKYVLYKEYDLVIFIIAGVFAVVKITETLIDIYYEKIKLKFENK